MKKMSILIILFICVCIFNAYAQAPQLINYQGMLKDAAGKPTAGPVSITFSIYSTAVGIIEPDVPLWTETHKEVPLSAGIFNVLLGSEKEFPKGLFIEGGERWLGITVDENAEMTPRFRFASVAYALNAAYAENASGGGNTLDQAYDQGGAGAGRSINADAGAVNITGSYGLTIGGIGTEPSYPLHILPGNNSRGLLIDHNKTTEGHTYGIYIDVDNTCTGVGQTYGIMANALKNNGSSSVYGLRGSASGNSTGVKCGVYGIASGLGTLWAGYFNGNVNVTGTFSKGGGSFKIDHPLDPKNKYLYHSFVESPDMMNIYNGNVILNANGEAWVELPEWFEALNKDFRYQLTCIGGYAQVFIAEKISNNRFKIDGGQQGLEVSWMVTGVRQDAFAEKNRIPVEEMKNDKKRGKYLHPKAYGMPETMGIDYEISHQTNSK